MFAKHLTYTKHYFNIYDGLFHLIFTSVQVPLSVSILWLRKLTCTYMPIFTLLESGGGGI